MSSTSMQGRNRLEPQDALAIRDRLHAYAKETYGTLRELARQIGVAYSTIQGWLRDPPRAPETPQLWLLATKGNLSVDWLLLGEGSQLRGGNADTASLEAALRDEVVSQLKANGEASGDEVEALVPPAKELLRELVRDYARGLKQAVRLRAASKAQKQEPKPAEKT